MRERDMKQTEGPRGDFERKIDSTERQKCGRAGI